MVARKSITIRKERFYPHPPEDVWAAITDPHALAEWLEPNNHQPIVGHQFQFRCDPDFCGAGITECQVLEADPPRRLVWSWSHMSKDANAPPPIPMKIAWTLIPKEGGTLLVLEHTGAENIGWLIRNMMRVGWGYMMKRLIPRVLAHVKGGAFTPGAIPLEKRFYSCKTIPAEYIR
jgi:uncharacterized protein YndB with AHSA1/START domain